MLGAVRAAVSAVWLPLRAPTLLLPHLSAHTLCTKPQSAVFELSSGACVCVSLFFSFSVAVSVILSFCVFCHSVYSVILCILCILSFCHSVILLSFCHSVILSLPLCVDFVARRVWS